MTRPQPRPPSLSPGDAVKTPSGKTATVLDLFPDVGEALVEWPDGDRARFRVKHLTKESP